ncbi:MAG: HAMP domain-containing sensor histidine kinase [Pseudomonadota bacterium]
MGKANESGYDEVLRDFRLEFSRVGAYICIVMALLGSILDYALYPAMQARFAAVRVVVSLLIFGVARLMGTTWGRPRVHWLTLAWLLLPQLMIAWMIGVTEGATSLYYVGLTLAIYASGIVLAFGMWQNLVFGAVTYLLFVAACAGHPGSFQLHGAFMVHSVFLVMSTVVSAVYTYFNERARFLLFRLQSEVVRKNNQLEATNKDLADIKGQMMHQEKMAAVGTLAAGLLHEVSNPINFCMMAIDIAAEQPTARDDALLAECLDDARQGMLRVQHIVSDLKTFAYRRQDAGMAGAPFHLEKALASAVRLIGHEIRDATVSRSLAPDTMVHGDEPAIIGVLINLLSNAALAFSQRDQPAGAFPATDPAGRTHAGRTHAGRAYPGRAHIHVSAEWHGDRLQVCVRDNGRGIAPDHLARVFEPFFTTRDVGQGLGLGLSISYGVIERHGGTLSANSVLGEWTEMQFDLPRADLAPVP